MAEGQGAAERSVLLVSGQYATSEDCSSPISRQVAQTLAGAGWKVYSTVLEDTEEDRKRAEADGVELILPTRYQGDAREPRLDWLTFDHVDRYPNDRLPQDVGWIVGHAGVTSRAAATIKEQRFPQARLSLVTQNIPEDTERYKKEERAMGIGLKEYSIIQDAEKADSVFSVGHRTYNYFINMFRAIPSDKSPAHYLFLPKPSDLFLNTTVEYRETSEKVVLFLVSRVTADERVKGFHLAFKALSKAVERSRDRINLRIRGNSKEEYRASMDILQTSINSGKLILTLLPHGTQEDICLDMQHAHLVLMPSRAEPFGLVGLEAMAAGVPVLISDRTGLADLVHKVVPEFHHSILRVTGDDSVDAGRWADQIADVLRMSEAEFRRAADLKQKLMESRYWEDSHQLLLQAFGNAGEVPIEVLMRGPEMARLYAAACRQGSLPVYSTRVPVVGQYRSGKTCFIKRLMGETVRDEKGKEEPITDGINIISDVQTKTYKKAQVEIDDLAGQLLRKQQETRHSAEEKNKAESSDGEAEGAPEDTEEEQEIYKLPQDETQSVRPELPSASTEEPTKEGAISEQEKHASERSSPLTQEPGKMEGRAPDHVVENAAIPDIVVEAAEKMREAGITEDELGTPEHPRLSFWDFGGQATYYGTHHCFITHRGVYILVMSLLQKLSDPVPDLDYKASVDNLKTGGDYLDHWLNTVRSHTLQHETRDPEGSQAAGQSGPQSSSLDKTSRGTGRPPVIIVLTHKDKVSPEVIEKYKEEIWSHIEGKAAGKLVMPEIFAVDNTTEDAAVDEIRDYIRQVARGLPHMGEEVPIQWLHLNSKLKIKRKEGPFCKFREVAELARDPDINITDRHTLALVLTFLHDRGDIIFFDEPSLCDDVILQPQVLIDVFKTIITVTQYQQGRKTDPQVRKMWERLEKEGVLSDELLTRIWEEKDRELEKPFLMYPDVIKMFETWLEQEGVLSNKQHELTRIWEKRSHQLQKPFLLQHKSFLKVLMEKFYLICNATPVGDANDEAQQEETYFVPALLSCKRNNARLYPSNMHKCPEALYFVFSEQFLPSGIFSRLQALCVRRFGLRESCVFAGCARFPTDDKEQSFVITKVNHYLKVELLSSNVLKFTEGLRVRKFLSSALFEIKEKWIPCIQYELCCSTQQENGSEPAFRALRTDDDEPSSLALPTSEGSSGQRLEIPSSFRDVWMKEFERSQPHRTENYEGGGLAKEDLQSIVWMCNIGPVLDNLNLGGELTLEQCDQVRSQETRKQRGDELLRLVENLYVLGAAVETCFLEFVHPSLMEKRGKELAILHTGDSTGFAHSLQTAASESGLPCHTKVITRTDSITEKTVELLLNTDNRTVALVISIETLDDEHWANLDYEFQVRNETLLLPILLYPQDTPYTPFPHCNRHVLFEKLKQRSSVLYSLACEEIQMKEGDVSQVKLQRILQQVMTDDNNGSRVPILLLINDEYGTSKGGISTINCQASQILQGKAVVYCTVLQLNVPKQDQEAANRDDVTLIGPDPRGMKTEPTLDWLTFYHSVHYENLPKNVTCIIGQADITDTAARNIKDQRYPQADLIMFTHVIPEDTDYYKGGREAMRASDKEKDMLVKVGNAKAAFSVGKRIFKHFSTKYKRDKKPSHKIFLPKPSELFLATDVRPGGEQKVVLSIGRVRKVEKLKGHDLAGHFMREVVKIIEDAQWCVRGISEDDRETSQKILEDALNSPDLNPTLRPYGTQEDIRDDMEMAHLVLMPSRSEPFGLVGLEAIAAGIPVLISNQTGLADMILGLIKEKKLSAEHRNVIVKTGVNDRDLAGDVKRWAERIVDVLQYSDSEFEKAARLKRELLESRYWEESHNAFLQACNVTGDNIGKKSLSRKRFAHSPPPKPEKRIKVAKGPQDDGAGPSGLSTYHRKDDDMASGGSSPSSDE